MAEDRDPLTGLPGQPYFETQVKELLEGAMDSGRTVSLCIASMDGLEEINRMSGRPAGDKAVARLAEICSAAAPEAMVCRSGGNEIAIVLPDTERFFAEVTAEEVRANLAAEELGGAENPASASVVVACLPEDGRGFDELLAAARGALGKAAEEGGDRVVQPSSFAPVVDKPERVRLGRPGHVGREKELDALSERIEFTRYGSGGYFLVRGEPGSGKSSFLREVRRLCRNKLQSVAFAHCEASDAFEPYCGAVRLIEDHISARRLLAFYLRGVPEREAAQIRMLFTPEGGLLPTIPAPERRRMLFHGLCTVMRRLGRSRSLVFLLDDAYLLDAASLEVLNLLILVERFPLLVVCAVNERDEFDGGERRALPEFLQTASGKVNTWEIGLGGLAPAEMGELLSQLLPERKEDPGFDSILSAATGGNPLFAQEMVRLLISDGLVRKEGDSWVSTPFEPGEYPRSVTTALEARLSTLSQGAKKALAACGFLGGASSTAAVVVASGLGPVDAAAAIDDLSAAGVVEVVDEKVELLSPEAGRLAATEVGREALREMLLRTAKAAVARQIELPDATVALLFKNAGTDDGRSFTEAVQREAERRYQPFESAEYGSRPKRPPAPASEAVPSSASAVLKEFLEGLAAAAEKAADARDLSLLTEFKELGKAFDELASQVPALTLDARGGALLVNGEPAGVGELGDAPARLAALMRSHGTGALTFGAYMRLDELAVVASALAQEKLPVARPEDWQSYFRERGAFSIGVQPMAVANPPPDKPVRLRPAAAAKTRTTKFDTDVELPVASPTEEEAKRTLEEYIRDGQAEAASSAGRELLSRLSAESSEERKDTADLLLRHVGELIGLRRPEFDREAEKVLSARLVAERTAEVALVLAEVSAAAARGFLSTGQFERVAHLGRAFSAAQEEVRKKAYAGLESGDFFDLLVSDVDSPEGERSARAGEALKAFAGAVVARMIEQVKTEPDYRARRLAAEILHQAGPGSAGALYAELGPVAEAKELARAVEVLDVVGGDYMPVLAEILKDERPEARGAAMKVATRIERGERKKLIGELVSAGKRGLRAALELAGRLKDPMGLEVAEKALAEGLAQEAADSLARLARADELDRRRAVKLLSGVIESARATKNGNAAFAAVWALSQYRLPDSDKALEEARTFPVERVAELADDVLKRRRHG